MGYNKYCYRVPYYQIFFAKLRNGRRSWMGSQTCSHNSRSFRIQTTISRVGQKSHLLSSYHTEWTFQFVLHWCWHRYLGLSSGSFYCPFISTWSQCGVAFNWLLWERSHGSFAVTAAIIYRPASKIATAEKPSNSLGGHVFLWAPSTLGGVCRARRVIRWSDVCQH